MLARLRRWDERMYGPAVPKPPTVKLRHWPILSYPDPWWAAPALYLGIASCLLALHFSLWAGVAATFALLVISLAANARATRQLRAAWAREWERLGQLPAGPAYVIKPDVEWRRNLLLVVLALAVAAVLLAILG